MRGRFLLVFRLLRGFRLVFWIFICLFRCSRVFFFNVRRFMVVRDFRVKGRRFLGFRGIRVGRDELVIFVFWVYRLGGWREVGVVVVRSFWGVGVCCLLFIFRLFRG